MINHARTLLVNLSPHRADYGDEGYDGYEYIAPTFKPAKLPPRLLSLRNVLFGADPDGLFVGLRARELMSYIHQTELAEYAYAFDKRVTYWPETKEFSAADKQRISISQVYGAPRRISTIGELSVSPASGIAFRSYSVLLARDDDGAAAVRVKMLEAPFITTQTDISLPAIPAIQLPQSPLKIKIAETNLTTVPQYLLTESSDTLIVESFDQSNITSIILESFSLEGLRAAPIAQWQIATRAKPQPVITSLMPTLELMGEQVFVALFGVKSVEPYTTFKNLWFDHPLPMYRLAGLTLALIYRTEEIRGKNA
jgi:hypothetical protein